MIGYIAIFLAGFVRVFAAGFQSRNVNTGKVKSAAATSFVIAISEGAIIVLLANCAQEGWASSVVYGLSGACAIVLAMKLHDRLHGPRAAR